MVNQFDRLNVSHTMHHLRIPFADTHRFSQIVIDYLQADPALQPYYQYPVTIPAFADAISDKEKETIDRALLVQVLQQQYAGVNLSDATRKNIADLSSPDTFCVVTAHQLNLFTGPLYVIYKTISAISLCRRLSAHYPDKRFVPVFWLGSEDHDFAEINHASVFGKTFTWEDQQGGACGRYALESLQPLLETLIAALGEGPQAEELAEILRTAYAPQYTLAQAGRHLLHALFGRFGLVVIDGDDRALKAACLPMILDELQHRSANRLIAETMQHFPYPAQATPREINLFYLDGNVRERIVFDPQHDIYTVLNTTLRFTAAEMLQLAEAHPERFSPNVILRPLFQQKVLPSLAYIGGGGEVAYWLQLKEVFRYHHVAFPVLMLRDSFMLVDAPQARKLEKLGMQVTEMFGSEHGLIEEFVRRNTDAPLELRDELRVTEELFARLAERVKAMDPGLESTVLAERQALLNSLHKLEAKLLKAQKSKMEVQVKQVSTLYQKLFPGGGLQERKDNFIPWFLRLGPGFLDVLLETAEQPVTGFTILTESVQA